MKVKLISIMCLMCLALTNPAYSAEEPQFFDLEFKGGTVTDFVDAIKDLDINVLTTPEGLEMGVPKFKLRNVTSADLFTALNLMGESKGFVWQTIGSQENANYPGMKNTWVLKEVQITDKHDPEYKSKPEALPIAIGFLLKDKKTQRGFTIEQITTAIQKTVEADYKARGEDGKDRIVFLYHKETELLIVSGEQRAVNLAITTIDSLRQSLIDMRG